MAKKIYVGGLPYSTSEDELRELFAAHGDVVSVQIKSDRETGRSRGFGFVEMSNDEEAQAAITALHGYKMEGRDLTVNEAKPMEERPRGNFGGGSRGGFGGGSNGGHGGGDFNRGSRY